jgi:hypothetical protein
MLRDRAALTAEWLVLGTLVIATLARAPSRPEVVPAPSPVVILDVITTPAAAVNTVDISGDPLVVADRYYREGEPEHASRVIRWIATTDELRSLAELYDAYARELRIATDPHSSMPQVFEALRSAQSLDIALGSAFIDDLGARMRVIAPRAYEAYLANHDAPNALLARHTAEIYSVAVH